MRSGSQRNGLVIVSVCALFLLFCLFFVIAYASGNWVPRQNSKVTALNVCVNKEDKPVETIQNNVKEFYLCGQVEGTTYRTGTLYVFHNNTVIFQQGIKFDPGIFFFALYPQDFSTFQTGTYRAEIGYAHQILAQVKFTVAD